MSKLFLNFEGLATNIANFYCTSIFHRLGPKVLDTKLGAERA
jgi:hypothetical protein